MLPFGDASLVGTTDLPFEGDPAEAVATPAELDYLLRTVNSLLPDVSLSAADVDLHYCGVRPLPYVGPTTPAAVTRRHAIVEIPDSSPPLYSIVGGKLTTSLVGRRGGPHDPRGYACPRAKQPSPRRCPAAWLIRRPRRPSMRNAGGWPTSCS